MSISRILEGLQRKKYFHNCEFIAPELCADYIMKQLYDGPSTNPWVVVELENGICFPGHLNYAMENEDKYYEITWGHNGKLKLEKNK